MTVPCRAMAISTPRTPYVCMTSRVSTTSAVAAGCWFLIGERWMRPIVPARWPRRLAALAGALVAATAFTVWNQSVVNEKVYTLSLLSIALILWLIVRWDDQRAGRGARSPPAADRLSARPHLHEPHDGRAGGAGGGGAALPAAHVAAARRPTQGGDWSGRSGSRSCAVFAVLMGTGLEQLRVPRSRRVGVFVAGAGLSRSTAATGASRSPLLGVAAVGLSVYVFLPIRVGPLPADQRGRADHLAALWAVLTRAAVRQAADHRAPGRHFGRPARCMWVASTSAGSGAHDCRAEHARRARGAVRRAGRAGRVCGTGAPTAAGAGDDRADAHVHARCSIFYLNFKYGYSQYLPRHRWRARCASATTSSSARSRSGASGWGWGSRRSWNGCRTACATGFADEARRWAMPPRAGCSR